MIKGNDPILLTPGPLTTSLETKQAMLRDWGSWDASFNAITASICGPCAIVHGEETSVPPERTFSVEAAREPVPRDGKVPVPQNGAYRQRILKILAPRPRDVALDIAEDRRERRDGRGRAESRSAITRRAGALRNRHRHQPLPDIAQACAAMRASSWMR